MGYIAVPVSPSVSGTVEKKPQRSRSIIADVFSLIPAVGALLIVSLFARDTFAEQEESDS